MMNNAFSTWTRWAKRTELASLNCPGVYALAISRTDLSGQAFSWQREIVYIGMTNAKGGLKSRLQQFDNTIKGGDGHGGGHRVRFKHPDYVKLTRRLYVSVCPQECDVTSNLPSDLRVMGKVANHEYECFAVFVEAFGHLPEFNDKQRSPKK
ncbi:MAG: hypothetical protein HZA13_06700 [Nitrospirae bacterium]|nr:hypothetical protein [Nitrospirota bacterium]